MPKDSIFWKILGAFLAFAVCLTIVAGIFAYGAADKFGTFLVKEQARPAIRALISAHKQASPGARINSADPVQLAAAINSEFYIGDDIPEEWQNFSPGIHFIGAHTRFVYIEKDDGIKYALAGSSRAFKKFLASLANQSIRICISGACLAVLAAFFLSGLLSRPLIALARSIGSIDHDTPLPDALLLRKDETGKVARAINRYQNEMREFARREAAFTNDVSHELRTPLMVLSGDLELIQANQHVPAGQLERMDRALKRMNTAITAMLCLARKASAPPEPVEIGPLLEHILAAQRDACHKFSIYGDQGTVIEAQKDIATVIFGNLIANACLHGKGDVNIHIFPEGLRIENSGSLQQTSNIKRAGLGLSIAARGCARLGWNFTLEEKEDQVMATVRWEKAPQKATP